MLPSFYLDFLAQWSSTRGAVKRELGLMESWTRLQNWQGYQMMEFPWHEQA